MKNLKIFLLLTLILLSLQKKISGKKRKLEESDSSFENLNETEKDFTDEEFLSDIEIDQGNSSSLDTNIISSNISSEEISISDTVYSTIIGNNTEIDKNPIHNTPIFSSKLILLGFGHYYRPIQKKEFIYFIVYFLRILGNIPSRYLTIPINIDYSTRLRLRFLEENKANCTRITDDNNVNIQYNCSVPVDPNKNISLLNIKGNDLNFGNKENVDYILSSIANQTKNNILNETGNDLDKGIIFIKDTIMEKSDEKFILIGNSSEIITDSKIILSLDNNGNIININCDSKNLLGKLYQFDCIPTQTINHHLNGVSGKTYSGHNLVINFQDGKNDYINFNVNNSNYDNNNNFDNNNIYGNDKVLSSSSGLSSGAIAGIIIGAAALLIAIVIIIGCLCMKTKKKEKPPFEESSFEQNIPKDMTNQSL